MTDESCIGPALLAATAVALSARGGFVAPHAVEQMRGAARALPADHALRFEMLAFAEAFEAQRRDPAALEALGLALDRGITRLFRAAPVDQARRDIHG